MVSSIFVILSNLLGFSGFMLDTTIYYRPAREIQRLPAVAFDGENYLVVWEDEQLERRGDIFGARISPSGEVLDKCGIPICIAESTQQRPVVTFDGKNFLVVWEDLRDEGAPPGIYGSWVTPSGEIPDTSGFLIYRPKCDTLKFLSIASSRTNYLIAWQEKVGRWWKIRGIRIDLVGHPIDSTSINICNYRYDQVSPLAVFGDTNYLVVWQELRGSYSNIYGARIDTSGEVLDTMGFPISDTLCDREGIGVSFDGRNYFVVWSQKYTWKGLGYDVYGTRVSQEGVVLDTEGIPIAKKDRDELNCGITFDGSNYLLTILKKPWWSCRDWGYYGYRINPEAEILDTFFICDPTNLNHIDDITSGKLNCLLVGSASKDKDICGIRIGKEEGVLDSIPILISTSPNEQKFPSVAFDGKNYLIVWQDDRRGPFNIYYSRVDTSGLVIDEPIPINEMERDQRLPSIGFDGRNYMVVWEDCRRGYDIYGARITPSGFVLDLLSISTEKGYQGSPSLSFNGENYLVVWVIGYEHTPPDIYGIRVTPSGLLLDSAFVIGGEDLSTKVNPKVTFGRDYFVVWERWFMGLQGNGDMVDVAGTLVNPSGIVLDTLGILICTETDGRDPTVAFDGINYLVVWEDERGSIYGTRVDESGVVLDSGGKPLATPTQKYPSLLFDGENYLLVYEDSNSIYGSRITPSLEILEEFPISSFQGERAYSSIAKGINNQYFVVYQSWTGPPYSAYRVYGALVGREGIKEKSKKFTSTPSLHIYPNPAKEGFFIEFALNKAQRIELSVYDATGRLVKRLKSGWAEKGYNKIFWDGRDTRNFTLSPGIYFIKLSYEGRASIRKVVFLKSHTQ